MMGDRRDRSTRGTQSPSETPRTRPGTFFRAAVIGAIATLVPAAGCYESEPAYGVPDDASETPADARDADVAHDTGPEDGADEMPLPPYGAPEYGAPVYGIP
jgi:hypothetical protein